MDWSLEDFSDEQLESLISSEREVRHYCDYPVCSRLWGMRYEFINDVVDFIASLSNSPLLKVGESL